MDTVWIALNCSEIQINGIGHYVFLKLTESEVGQYVKVRQLNLRRATDTNKRRGSLD